MVEAEVDALRGAGHEVELFAARTDDLEGDRLYPLRSALRVATGVGASPLPALRSFAPDIVHVHNLFPNFGRRWVRQVEQPLVHTLHNYRPLCANALLLRDGAVCTLCPDGDRWAGLRYACYRDSRLATAPISWANRRGPSRDPLLAAAERLLVGSERQRAVFEAAGAPAEKLSVSPSFLPDAMDLGPGGAGDESWLVVGRLSEEKGVVDLLEHWPAGEPLRIVGDGPQRAEVERRAAAVGARVLGNVPRPEVLSLMRSATGLVFPSIWYETAGLVYFEALAAGLPVVAFEPNVVADSVRQDGTGAVPERDERSLRAALERVRAERPALSARARSTFESRYSEAAFVARATSRYQALLEGRAG